MCEKKINQMTHHNFEPFAMGRCNYLWHGAIGPMIEVRSVPTQAKVASHLLSCTPPPKKKKLKMGKILVLCLLSTTITC